MNRALWWIGVSGRIVIVLFIALICFALSLPFLASLPTEFVDLPGKQAESRIYAYWSDDVDLRDVEKASGKIYSQIDCHARWYRITLRPQAVENWQQAIHAKLEKTARLGGGVDLIEGVHRTVSEPIPMQPSFGKPPKWWIPPSLEFRVTERMRWYADGGSTYADALYSAFDPSTNTLWIYDYGQQHDQLWSRGAVPAGDQFFLGNAMNHADLKREVRPMELDRR